MIDYIEMDYIQIEQPIGVFYIARIDWKNLIRISNADIRTIKVEGKRSDSFDSYLGIQREIAPGRINEISNYVRTIDATFPTSIILHVESSNKFIDGKDIKQLEQNYVDDNFDRIYEIPNIEIDNISKKLKIRADEKVARILDGQHRIEGLRSGLQNYSYDTIFQFNVTIFVDMDIDDQAQIFSVINKAQTKVNNSLVYDLYEYAKHRSPQKTAHDIVRLLNRMPESPCYKKIKILGTAQNKELETIAQATFVELILKYITTDAMIDRDILKRGKKIAPLDDEHRKQELLFRTLFIEKNDHIILSILINYFLAVKERWPNSWNINSEGNILNKSTGVIALMRFLKYVIKSIGIYDKEIKLENFKSIFDRSTLKDGEFNKQIFIPGSSGQSTLLKELRSTCGI
jgi:DGQHR domain-containing protein